MSTSFDSGTLRHVAGFSRTGDAATRVVSSVDFADAVAEITQWEGYAPTPLVELGDLAAGLGIAKLLYKHEGPRFGLGSFKALGGSYAALRVLQREISRGLGRNVSMADIRNGDYTDWAARVTLVSATDGNHGRALA